MFPCVITKRCFVLLNSAHMELNKVNNHAEPIGLKACSYLRCASTFRAFETASSSMGGLRWLIDASFFPYTLAACLTLICVSVFQSYRHTSSQYRMHVFVCLVHVFIHSIRFSFFPRAPISPNLCTSLISYALNSLFTIWCLLFMSLKD